MSLAIAEDKTENKPEQGSFWINKKNLLFLSLALCACFLVYLPSLQNGFVNWDDQANLYENPYITNITNIESFFESAKGIFSTHVIGNYNPLSIFSFACEKLLWGLDNPAWFHLNNILLHLICVLLVFRITLALGLQFVPAVFCALLFGIHPMRVESVAWITERKDVLFGSFYLLALYFYIKSVKSSFRKRYLLTIHISFILALLSKIQAVSLPLSMLLVDYYFDRKLSMKLIYEKWLYFTFSLVTGIVGVYFLRVDGGIENNNLFPLFERFFIGSYAYIVYVIKSIAPYKMVPVYAYPAAIDWLFYASMVPALCLLGLTYYFFLKREKTLVFGLLFFTVNIMFVLQILGAGQGFIADRFTYIAYFGLFLIYASAFEWVLGKYKKFDKAIYVAAMLVLSLFGYLNYEQNKIWRDGETLWTYVIENYPSTALAWENRASYYESKGRTEEALNDYSKAIALKNHNHKAYNSRGNVYANSNYPNKFELSLQDYDKAIQYSPGSGEYLVNRGMAYFNLDKPEKALRDLDSAEKITPENRLIYSYRSRIHFKLENLDKAQSDLERYLNINPYDPFMWSNLGMVTRVNKQYGTSLNAFNKAIKLNSDNLDYYYKRSKTYFQMGDIQMARNDLSFLKANGFKEIHPDYEKLISKRD